MTIYALSSGPGISGVAVIRISGQDTSKVIKLLTGKEPPKPRVATLRKINKINNSELILDRKVADKRIYPALDITRSGTRREELLFGKDDLSKMNVLRRIISPMGTMDGKMAGNKIIDSYY